MDAGGAIARLSLGYELADSVAEVECKPVREVADGIEDKVAELNDHYNRCRTLLAG